MARVRKNVLSLGPVDQTLVWYARAVDAMQKKAITDPTSWRYQSAIHDYDKKVDPFAKPKEKLPGLSQRKKYWQQCQHGSWFFLPWHRMYVHFFEQIVLKTVIDLGGPSDWALPYWNYSASTAAAALLPAEFRNPSASGSAPNPLFIAARDANANAGKTFASPTDTALTYCLKRTKFPGSASGGSAGFGGPVTAFEHGGAVIGSLENIPHGTMHMAVAGSSGWMGDFRTAPLDPIFWLHHSNLDRVWEVWLKRDPLHQNPTTSNWLNKVSFDFHDASGSPTSMTVAQVLNTSSAPLDYTYDDMSDPLGGIGPAAIVSGLAGGATTAMAASPTQPVAEMIGASKSFSLDKVPTHQVVSLKKPTGPAAATAAMLASGTAAPRRVFLNIEGITSKARSVPYDVYINLPTNADPSQRLELHAGRISMFGLAESSQRRGKKPAHGLDYRLEITDLYHRLAGTADWDPNNLRVSFVPAHAEGAAPAKVGRVSVYLA